MEYIFRSSTIPMLLGKNGEYHRVHYGYFIDQLSGQKVAIIGVHNGDYEIRIAESQIWTF